MNRPRPVSKLAENHGRPFIALSCAFLAWVTVQIAVYVRALWLPRLDVATVLASAGILTTMAAAYGGFAAYVKARSNGSVSTETIEDSANSVD